MATSQQLTPPVPPPGHYDIDISRSDVTGNPRRDRRVRSASAAIRTGRIYFGMTASPGLAGRYLDMSLQVRYVRNSRGGAIADV